MIDVIRSSYPIVLKGRKTYQVELNHTLFQQLTAEQSLDIIIEEGNRLDDKLSSMRGESNITEK